MSIIKKCIFSGILLVVLLFIVGVTSIPVQAQESGLFKSQTGLSEIGKKAYGNSSAVDIRVTAAKIINVVLTFIGAIFLGLTIFAGFQYMTAAGNEENTKKALSLLKNAVIGLVIISAAWMISRFSIVIFNRTVKNNAVDYTTDINNY